MVANSVRLIDNSEKLNSFGRIEVRVLDTWHSVCGDSFVSPQIATILCEAGGYLSGEVFYPQGSEKKGCYE